MKKVKLEETFLVSDYMRLSKFVYINRGLYKRLVLSDDTVVWVAFNDGKSDYGGHSNMDYIRDVNAIKGLEKMYVATTREQQISSVID
jgi:hypothetical protein